MQPADSAQRTKTTDGIYIQCGNLRLSRYNFRLQLAAEQYAQRDTHFWFGVQASSKAALKWLEEIQKQSGRPLVRAPAEYFVSDKEKGHYRLAQPLKDADWEKAISEYHDEDDEWFLGYYVKPQGITGQILGETAAEFWRKLATP
jgi:hypothetical protein